ncbi:hypothetical protein BDZ94DRAFT_1303364 [Collybia nuda]|uniref:Uncharacterized protein n=1 Tax=Collybia nuda TaxID=64659 RepID=A0A9P5YIL2_9AGAR|nr:hypothetical protein BDZ94DRAFT_1303364 [Collybia nuda]
MSLTIQDIRKTARAVVETLEDADAERIKEMMVHRNSNVSLARPPHNPQAIYHVLWYKFALSTAPNSSTKMCHVDIFLPGIISLPAVPANYVVHSRSSGLPLIPFLAALLHKVLAWVAHGKSSTQHGRFKQAADASDIRELLEIAMTTYESNLSQESWPGLTLPGRFINHDPYLDGARVGSSGCREPVRDRCTSLIYTCPYRVNSSNGHEG